MSVGISPLRVIPVEINRKKEVWPLVSLFISERSRLERKYNDATDSPPIDSFSVPESPPSNCL